MQLAGRALLAALALVASCPLHADEGMWTLDNFPRAAVKEKYHVDISADWLKRIQRSITRHETGCTGSFVSPQGLVMTNHHCAIECVSDLSSSTHDYVADGFVAASQANELRCEGQTLSVLIDTEEVTAQVDKATADLPDAKANEVRKSELSKLEAACTAAARKHPAGPLACEAVNLYQGGQYFLYKYKRYSDVRLVFAPHIAIASFGGDPDNFNYPRWAMDVSLLRAYENGAPAATPHHLRWRSEGPKAGEPVFVAGHPGTTHRLWTNAQLQFQRDTLVPAYIARNSELRGRFIQWSKTGDEPLRISQDPLASVENSLKVYRGLHQALLSEAFWNAKTRDEQRLRTSIANDPRFKDLGDPWRAIETAQERYRHIYERYMYVESGMGFKSKLFGYARWLVRGTTETNKPNAKRLREYAESNLHKVTTGLFNDAPVYPQFEQLLLSFSLDKMRENLGPDDPLVRKLMSVESPDSLAAKLIAGTQLADPKLRKQLWDGGPAAVAASTDPLIVLARDIDPDARALRKVFEDEVQAVTAANQEKIAKARFAVLGTNTYPDATFTLRMSYGAVESWNEKGAEVPNFTRLSRLYERATGKAPFALPKLWLDKRKQLDPNTPFDYVTSNDIIGGNSGSPVIDAQGRLVGLVFDGNIHSISGSYWYDATANRMIAVHPQIILTALKDIYGAQAIAREIVGTE